MWGVVMGLRIRSVVVGIVFATMLGESACASGGGQGGRQRRLWNVITFEELDGLDVADCHEAIQRLRPAWLRPRARRGMPEVVLDGVPLRADIHALVGIQLNGVREIRFLSALDATTRFGRGYLNGAILVTTGVRDVRPDSYRVLTSEGSEDP